MVRVLCMFIFLSVLAATAIVGDEMYQSLTIRLIPVLCENVNMSDENTLVLSPGQRAVFAAELPLNFNEAILQWQTDSSIRITLTQLGLTESLALGETLTVTPQPYAVTPGTKWNLHSIRNRYASLRKWPMPKTTNDAIPFFVISTTSDTQVTVSNLCITGKIELPTAVPSANRILSVMTAEQDNGFFPIIWPDTDSETTTKPFSLDYSGTHNEGGVPFTANPIYLADNACVAIPINQTAGEFHFLHTAGKGQTDTPLVGEYFILYEDNEVETIHIVKRWNCGIFANGFQSSLQGDSTWWGPTGYPKAEVIRLAKALNGLEWNALYRTSYRNPRPDKIIREIRVQINAGQSFALAALTMRTPETSVIGLIEPARAVFNAGSTLPVALFEYSAVAPTAIRETQKLQFSKDNLKADAGFMTIQRNSRFGAGFATLSVPAWSEWTGPVVIDAGSACSSTLGLMPTPTAEDRPYYFNMIMTGSESADQCDWVYRLGYDAAVIHSMYWKDDPEVWKERIKTFADAGLSVRIRPHGLKLKTPQNITTYRFADKQVGSINNSSVFDPVDPNTRKEVIARQVALAELGKQYPTIISQETSYHSQQGLQATSNASTLYCGVALWDKFIAHLKNLYTSEDFTRNTGLADFSQLDLAFVAEQPNGLLLTELVKLSVEANSTLQREISLAVHAVNPRLFQVFHAGYRDAEQIFAGRTLPEYLRIGSDINLVSTGNAAAERYWSSFEQWMAGARTFGFDHTDEICANPPPYEHARRAFLWMAAFQTREASYCRFSVGRPSAQNIAELKPFHHLLRNAEYLPDPVALAHSFRSGYADAPKAGRQPRHKSQLAAYSLINALRVLNINPDRYLLDDFPEKDSAFQGKLLIDDCNRAIPDDFAARIESFVRKGGTFLASADTDQLNDRSILRRFGMVGDEMEKGLSEQELSIKEGVRRIFSKNIGDGQVVVMDASWQTGKFSYDIGYESENVRAFYYDLLTECGNFIPRVCTDTSGVCAVPYQAKDGSILVYTLNLAGVGQTVAVGLSKQTLDRIVNALDYRTGQAPEFIPGSDLYHEVRVFIPPLSATVLRFE